MILNLIFLAFGAFGGTFFVKHLYGKYKFYNMIIPFFILVILARVNLYEVYTYGLIYGFGVFIGFCSEVNTDGNGYFVDCILVILSSIALHFYI